MSSIPAGDEIIEVDEEGRVTVPDWYEKYDGTSVRVLLDSLEDAPLVPNSLDSESEDDQPQRLVPVYFNFETGGWFYYEQEAIDLHAGASRNEGEPCA